MDDEFYPEIHEKTFKTTMTRDAFENLVKRTCRAPYQLSIEARDVTEVPSSMIWTAAFQSVEDRDRMTIAMRFADQDRVATPAPKTTRRAGAGTYVAA